MANNIKLAQAGDHPCVCGSSLLFSQCCGPLLRGQQSACSPLALMRARFSAFVLKNYDFIESTAKKEAWLLQQKSTGLASVNWEDLQIIEAKAVKRRDCYGYVEFIARGTTIDGQPVRMHERSRFQKISGQWYYISGKQK